MRPKPAVHVAVIFAVFTLSVAAKGLTGKSLQSNVSLILVMMKKLRVSFPLIHQDMFVYVMSA